ncbi:glycosyltransferase family 39 protein [Streptomyces sp. URMC 129]|uniref:glycosyltransferase family 39 protein n=1 Tax=Streptomyces sp. URMC 129 TaxID=3423407 RepID=UPI003F19B471
MWRSPAGQPPWARPALLAVAALAALLYAWNITTSGYALYYSAAARSMTESWTAFLFTSFDPSAAVTLDKIGGFLWPQAISARVFGYSQWSLTLPHCVAGVVTVLVTYRMVRRWQGPAAGLLAAVLITLTPLLASLFGHPLIDGPLTMCLVLAADQFQRAVRDGRLRPLLLAGVWIGLGFQVKMMQAWLIVPALGLAYLLTAPIALRRRVRHVLVAGVATLAVSLSWVALMTLMPQDARPYVDGSTNNSAVAMVFGYNGVGRMGIDLPGAVSTADSHTGTTPTAPTAPTSGAPSGTGPGAAASAPGQTKARAEGAESWLKLVDGRFDTQIAWLFPIALLSLAFGLARRRRAEPYADQARGGYLMHGGWLLVAGGVLSAMDAVPHTGYAAVLAPPLAALAAAGTVAMWRARRRWVLTAAIAVQTAWACRLVADHRDWVPWLIPLLITAGLVAVAALTWSARTPRPDAPDAGRRRRLRRRVAVAGLVAGCVAMYAAPAVWSLSVLDEDYGGSAFDAEAGPAEEAGRGGLQAPPQVAASGPGAAVADELSPEQEALLAYVTAHNDPGTRFTFSTDDWMVASPYIRATGTPVLPLGGFSGQATVYTLAEYQALVADGELRFAVIGGGPAASGPAAPGTGAPGTGDDTSELARITAWVTATCAEVAPAEYGAAERAAPETSGGTATGSPTLYDCSSEER